MRTSLKIGISAAALLLAGGCAFVFKDASTIQKSERGMLELQQWQKVKRGCCHSSQEICDDCLEEIKGFEEKMRSSREEKEDVLSHFAPCPGC